MNQEVNSQAMLRGLSLGAFIAVNYVLSTYQATSFISWGVEALLIYYVYKCVVDCRENILEGVISYGGALWYVVKLFLYSSMVAGVFKYVYLKWLRPDFLTQQMGVMHDLLKQAKVGGAMMDQYMDAARHLMTAENMALYSIVGDVMLGTLLGLVLAAIVKRDETWRHIDTNEE